MQPYFFPYIGYWQLIHAVDVFVVYDDGKMITNGWIHRNRILDFDGQTPRTIGVPMKKKSVSHTIGEMERALAAQIGDEAKNFMRIGKRFIINMRYVYQINVLKQQLILSDYDHFAFQVNISKDALRKMKDLMLITKV